MTVLTGQAAQVLPFNRTDRGIEMSKAMYFRPAKLLLIAPIVELKYGTGNRVMTSPDLLIAPIVELK